MIKIGITGQQGFIGSSVYNMAGLFPDQFTRIPFSREYFEDTEAMDAFVASCDTIVHLAAMNRHESQEFIYETNKELVRKLVESLERTGSKAHVLFSSSTQEERDNLYGRSKREGREMLADWAKKVGARFDGLLIPNVFGPFGKPFYNSFVATFCHQLTTGGEPKVDVDSEVSLIYVEELAKYILDLAKGKEQLVKNAMHEVKATSQILVSDALKLLKNYRNAYLLNGEIPALNTILEVQLFNTFRSFIDYQTHFPVKYKKNTDNRGSFVEIIRLSSGGQVSFSTTHETITRGNHYHTRKIERFSVIKGKARIQLRKINTTEVLNFDLDGEEPAFVDMPVWYTHNIMNIGTEDLYTIFWINEFFDPADPDTYFETV